MIIRQCQYAIANKDVNFTLLMLTLIATEVGGGFIFGKMESLYNEGAIFFFASFGALIGTYWVAKWVAPKIADYRFNDCISIADVMGVLYGKKVADFTGVMGLLFSIVVVAMEFTALGIAFSGAFGVDYTYSTIIVSAIVIAYSSLGGVRSVAVTDIFQFSVFIAILPIMATNLFGKVGGIEVFSNVFVSDFSKELKYQDWNHLFYFLLTAFPFAWLLYPAMIQRFLMSKDKEQIQKSLKYLVLIVLCLIPTITILGLSARMLLPEQDGKDILIILINEEFPMIVKGLALAGIFSVIMSTADSTLNAGAVMGVHNVLGMFGGKKKGEIIQMKIFTVILGVLAMIIAINKFSILHVASMKVGVWGGAIGVTLVLTLFGYKISVRNFFITVIAVFFATLLAINLDMGLKLLPGFAAIVTGLISYISFYIFENRKDFYRNLGSGMSNFSFKSIFFKAKEERSNVKWLYSYNPMFAVFCCINYIVPFFMWPYDIRGDSLNLVMSLRLTAGMLCVGLLLKDIWPARLKEYFHIYWLCTLTFCLPFFTTLMIFLQSASLEWLLNSAIAITLLLSLLSWVRFIGVMTLGVIAAIVFHNIYIGSIVSTFDGNSAFLTVYTLFFFSLVGILFIRSRESLIGERFKMLESFGGIIAHEVKTPLISNQHSFNTISNIINSESKIKRSDDVVNIEMSESNFKTIKYLMNLINKSNLSGQKTADMLLMSIKRGELHGEKERLSVKKCLDDALEGYVFSNKQRQQVRVHLQKDIEFIGDAEQMKHVFFNLFKNAFRHAGSKVEIDISLSDKEVRFKDSGVGISDEILRKIFDDFYSQSRSGTGLGLPFCKRVMKNLGGDIKCISKEGEYTEFILEFPKV